MSRTLYFDSHFIVYFSVIYDLYVTIRKDYSKYKEEESMNGTTKVKHLYELIKEVCFTTGAYEVPVCNKLFSKFFCFDTNVDFRKTNYLKLAAYNSDAKVELEEGLEYYADLSNEECEIMHSDLFVNVVYPQMIDLINSERFDHIADRLERITRECGQYMKTYKAIIDTLRPIIFGKRQSYINECCNIIDRILLLSDEKERNVELYSRYVRNIRSGNYQIILDLIELDFDEIKGRVEDLDSSYTGFVTIVRDSSADVILELIAETYHMNCLSVAQMNIIRNTNAVQKICEMMNRKDRFYTIADSIDVGGDSLLEVFNLNTKFNTQCRRYVVEHLSEAISYVVTMISSKNLEIDRFLTLKKSLLETIAMHYRLFKNIFERIYYLNESTGEYDLTDDYKGINIYPERKKLMIDLYEMKSFIYALNSEQMSVGFIDNILGNLCSINEEMKFVIM